MIDLTELMEDHIDSQKLFNILENNLSNKKFEIGSKDLEFGESFVKNFSVLRNQINLDNTENRFNMLPDKKGKPVFTITIRLKQYYGGNMEWIDGKWVETSGIRNLCRYYMYKPIHKDRRGNYEDIRCGVLYIWLISDGYCVVAEGAETRLNPVVSYKVLELGELVENLKKPENLINIKNFYIS